jgi:hypothetical protein
VPVTLPEEFTKHVNDWSDLAFTNLLADSLPGLYRRRWAAKTFFPIGIDIQDPTGFVTMYTREELNQKCIDAYTTGPEANRGRAGEVMALKSAIDYLAAAERAMHASHASPARLRTWAMARRDGHADKVYGAFAQVRKYMDDTLAAASAYANQRS